MPTGLGGIVCIECGGSGCSACSNSGYAQSCHAETILDLKKQQEIWAGKPIVPMPYGKILPDLADCYYPNDPWPKYLEPIICPSCSSDNVVGLSDKYNPGLKTEHVDSGGRWFCISCQDSWCYERER